MNLYKLSAPPSDSIARALFPRAVRPISDEMKQNKKRKTIKTCYWCEGWTKLPVEFWNTIRVSIYLVWDLLLRPTIADRPSKSVDLICKLVHLWNRIEPLLVNFLPKPFEGHFSLANTHCIGTGWCSASLWPLYNRLCRSMNYSNWSPNRRTYFRAFHTNPLVCHPCKPFEYTPVE